MVFQEKTTVRNKSFWEANKTKIVSTAAAVVIWLLIVAGETYDYTTDIPIELTSVDRDIIITSGAPAKAKVLIEGQGRFLFTFMLFREGKLRLNVAAETGTQILRPTEKDVFLSGVSQNLTLRRLIWPDSIIVQVDRVITRELPVANKISLKPAPGYTIVDKPTLTPNRVKVRGPQSLISQFDSIPTQTLELDNLKFPIERKIPLSMPNGQEIKLLTAEVVVSAEIQKLMEKTIANVPVTVRYLPQQIDAIVIPSELTVVIVGGVEVVYGITAKDIQAYIEYHKGLSVLTEECPVIIEPIGNVRFREIKPDRFKVVLQHQRIE